MAELWAYLSHYLITSVIITFLDEKVYKNRYLPTIFLNGVVKKIQRRSSPFLNCSSMILLIG